MYLLYVISGISIILIVMFIYKHFIMSIKKKIFYNKFNVFCIKKKKEKRVDSLVLNPQMEKNEYTPF